MSSHILKKLYNISVYTIGACVLLAATIATLIRIALPDIGMYRSEVEAWVSNYMELPVVIHSINADWSGWTPQLYLEQIDLMNSSGTEAIINFERANISIDLYSSLLRRQIVPEELTISGLDISVTRLKDGSIDIEGIEVGGYKPQAQVDDELGNWFFNQRHIRLQQANIEWLDMMHDQPPLRIMNVGLTLRTDGERLQLEGSSSLPEGYGNDMTFAIDVTGNLLSTDWSANVYLQANNIQPDNWYKEYWPDKLILSGGDASISLWSTLSNTKINSFRGSLQYNDVALFTEDKHIIDIQNLESEFSGLLEDDGSWLFDIHLKKMLTGNHDWPETDFSVLVSNLKYTDDFMLNLDFSYLNLDDIRRFMVFFPNLPSFVKTLTTDNEIIGELNNGKISFTANAPLDEQFQFIFSFKDLNSKSLGTDPYLSGVSGELSGSTKNGQLTFVEEQTIVQHFRGNDLITLNGNIQWDKTPDETILSSDNLSISNAQINAQLSGIAKLSSQGSFVDILLEAGGNDIQTFIQYMPYSSKFRARDWIATAVPSGSLNELKLLIRGELKDFPFDNNNGQFLSTAKLSNAALEYSKQFPAITEIDADLEFHGRKMQINIQNGKIFDSYFSNATANIPNLFTIRKNLGIKGLIIGETRDLKSYISNSPLNKDLLLAKVNDSLAPLGKMQLNLDLMIPLRNPDQKLSVTGLLSLEDAAIVSSTNTLRLDNLNGDVKFTESSIIANEMMAKFDGDEVTLSIEGDKNTTGNPARVSISGKGNEEFITRQLNTYFPKLTDISETIKEHLTGNVNWEASLNYVKDSNSPGLRRYLQIHSDLNGMAIDLPAPFAKKGYETVGLELEMELDQVSDKKINLNYGGINSELMFNENKFDYANINLGGASLVTADAPGINIVGNLDYLNVDRWIGLISNKDKSSKLSDSPLINARISVNTLEYLGQAFHNTSISANNSEQDWHIAVNSSEINGDISLTRLPDGKNHFIANLQSLHIKKATSAGSGVSNPSALPSMLVHIESFKYDDIDLGDLKLTAVPTNNGLLIEDISFHKDNMHIRANGKWSNNRYTGSASSFFINVHADEINYLLKTFGFSNDSISKAETSLTINANWPGTPFNFALAKLNGTIDLDMKKGALLDIQPAAGRLFGLLSLQTLPRRLVLDFSDLFGTGMAFDSIKGTFSVKDGNAYTDNLAMKGPSVNIDIRGRAGLSNKDYDQLAVITPQISDSLAVASGFLGPIGIGLGTVLYLASNMFEPLENSINRIMKVEYNIKGSWDNPEVERKNENTDS